MSTQPPRDWSEIKLKELCRWLDTELEVVGNLIYLVTHRRQQPQECDRYLKIAQTTVERMRKDIQKVVGR